MSKHTTKFANYSWNKRERRKVSEAPQFELTLVHDGQNAQKAGKLRKNWHAVETHATAYADLILAVRSAYFIGNPASSFSANVVMIRRALGAAPESSNLRVLDFPRPGSYK